MTCPKCNTENPAEYSFCLQCGEALPAQESAETFANPKLKRQRKEKGDKKEKADTFVNPKLKWQRKEKGGKKEETDTFANPKLERQRKMQASKEKRQRKKEANKAKAARRKEELNRKKQAYIYKTRLNALIKLYTRTAIKMLQPSIRRFKTKDQSLTFEAVVEKIETPVLEQMAAIAKKKGQRYKPVIPAITAELAHRAAVKNENKEVTP